MSRTSLPFSSHSYENPVSPLLSKAKQTPYHSRSSQGTRGKVCWRPPKRQAWGTGHVVVHGVSGTAPVHIPYRCAGLRPFSNVVHAKVRASLPWLRRTSTQLVLREKQRLTCYSHLADRYIENRYIVSELAHELVSLRTTEHDQYQVPGTRSCSSSEQ